MSPSLSKVAAAGPVPMPSDTNIPGLSRRHVWAAPEVASHSLVVLTLPRLYLAPFTGVPKREKITAIEKTYDLEGVLGPISTTIEMASIVRVRLNLIQNAIMIDHAPVRGGMQRTRLVFTRPETADVVFSKIWRRLDSGFTLRPYRPDTWELARTPLLVMMAFAIGTAAISLTLNAIADVYGGTDWVTAGFLPGWRAVCVTGGAAVAAAHIWLYRRLTQPPERLELVRL